jgi:hypothetical protein
LVCARARTLSTGKMVKSGAAARRLRAAIQVRHEGQSRVAIPAICFETGTSRDVLLFFRVLLLIAKRTKRSAKFARERVTPSHLDEAQ